MPYKDPEQKRTYERAYREANKAVLHSRVVACNRKARHERYAKIQGVKEGQPCADCGRDFPYYVMDFDHHDPSTKVADVSQLVKKMVSWPKVEAEIAKCDLVCANCHRLRTYKGQHCYKTRRFEQQRIILDQVKSSTPCIDCGKQFQPCQMDFDHVDPQSKVANIARLMGGSTEALLVELGKCHLVCANCHRVRESTGVRPDASEHSLKLVADVEALLEAVPVPKDRRHVPFPFPHLLGKVSDKELSAMTGISRNMVAWHRRKIGVVLTCQGERVQP